MDIENKVCIITGSLQGLGKEFARILLEHGAKVCLSDLKDKTSLQESSSTVKDFKEKYGNENVCYIKCDVTNEHDFISLFDEAEKFFNTNCVDILVNNAGINGVLVGWRKCMEVNIIGVMNGTDIALNRMKKASKKGSIINTASMAGFTTGAGEKAIGYSASKHGVVALTRTLAVDFKYTGVSIKAICPSWTDTEIVSSAKDHVPKERLPELEKRINNMGGLMSPEHVAKGFYKLVTECGNGDIMAVLKGVPFLLMPDDGELKVMVLAMMAKIVGKVTGNDIVSVTQEKVVLTFLLLLLVIFLNWFF